MKKRAVLFLIFILLVALIQGCNDEPVIQDETVINSPIPTEEEIVEDPVSIRIFDPEATMGLDFSDYNISFQELIKEKFNIDLTITLSGWPGSQYFDLVRQSDIFLFKDLGLHGERRWMVENNVILPFNDYLENNETWLSLPEGFRNAFADANGKIWAIPYSDTPQIWARAIRKDWLDQTKLEVPETVDELYNMMQVFTYNDPDGNGNDDTFGSGLSDRLIRCFNFKDIFEANGCYMSYSYTWSDEWGVVVNNTMAGYNPETGRVEDLLFNPSFLQTLETIESMIDNGFINLQPDTFMNGVISSPNVGSHMGLVKDNIIYPDTYEYCYSLEGVKDKNTATVLFGNSTVYYLTSAAKEPEKIVPAFLEMMYGDIEAYKLMRYGMLGEGHLYSEKAGIIYKNDVEEPITSHLQMTGNLSWFNEDLVSDIKMKNGAQYLNIGEVMGDDNIMPMSHIQMALVEKTTVIINMNPDGSYPNVAEYYYHDLVEAFMSFYRKEIGAEELYDRITFLHKKYGMAEWIADINQRWLGVN